MVLKFPNIDFDYWLGVWNELQNKMAYFTPKMNLYSKIDKGITYLQCETEILKIVEKINNTSVERSEVLKVIDLIYRWGGPSGRMFYTKSNNKGNSPRRELELQDDLFNRYCDAIDLALAGKSSSKFLFESINGIGPSFASKHAAFWSSKSTRPLIVIDSKIAGCFGKKKLELFEKEFHYDNTLNQFVNFGNSLTIPKTSQEIERSLFAFHLNFFNNENTNWQHNKRNAIKDKDFEIAKNIAIQLGIN
jgi:hypothetical protein